MFRRSLSKVSRRTRAFIALGAFALVSGLGAHLPSASAEEPAVCDVVQISVACRPGQQVDKDENLEIKPTTTVAADADMKSETPA